MGRFVRIFAGLVLLGGIYLLLDIYTAGSISAAVPPPDTACRECHGDSERKLTLPSGDVLSLQVDLDRLDASPHSSVGGEPVPCTGCHVGAFRYRYPHPPNSAETVQEFQDTVAENCQTCHYPHAPFHDPQFVQDQAPSCVDCHGSHAIARVEVISESMPQNCIDCHNDQPLAWAEDFLAPRPGMGEGAEGYAGSVRCIGCHENLYASWRETLHAQMVQDVTASPDAIVADFAEADPDLTFDREDVAYTVGSRHLQVFLTRGMMDTSAITGTDAITGTAAITGTDTITDTGTVSGTHVTTGTQQAIDTLSILPAQWNVAAGEWEPYDYPTLEGPHQDTAETSSWLTSCGSCHVTGLQTATWGFTEFGLGCETCHGPSAAHAADPERIQPYAMADDQVCGACHSRGISSQEYPFPETYRPGDMLLDHFTLVEDERFVWPDGSAKGNHQQYMDWQLGNTMEQYDEFGCTTCHAVHNPGAAAGQVREPLNELCLACHSEQQAIVDHVPFHEQAIQDHEFLCTDCHMPKLATVAQQFDLHSHAFNQPAPGATIEHGGFEFMPNACNQCHMDYGENPQWAAETIEYSRVARSPSSGFFGPGPTPTSPPPPTPIPSVGEPVERIEVPTGRWLRIAFFVLVGLVGVGVLFWIGWAVRTKGSQDV